MIRVQGSLVFIFLTRLIKYHARRFPDSCVEEYDRDLIQSKTEIQNKTNSTFLQ